MRNLLIASTATCTIVLGAASAFAAGNPNVPNWSPYAVMAYDDNGTTFVNPGYGNNPGYPPRIQTADEGRATYMTHRRWNDGSNSAGYDNQRINSAYPNEGANYGSNSPGYQNEGRAAYVEPGQWSGGGNWQYGNDADPHPVNSGYDNQRINSAYPNE
jgi:hypothetical protein